MSLPDSRAPQTEQQGMAGGVPRLCAHRGLSRACPENTVPALAAAAAVGAHEVEFDLWMSLDGVGVVCHDPALDRTTDGSGNVSEMRWEEIRHFDAGIKRGEEWRGVPVPRFEEALDAVGCEVGVNIHVKATGPGDSLVKLVCDTLRERDLMGRAYLAAGAEEVLRAVCEYAPDTPRACLFGKGDPDGQIATAVKYGCQRIQFGRGGQERHFRSAGQAGLVRNLFFSDDAEEALRYGRDGVDVVLTNCAHQLMADGIPARL